MASNDPFAPVATAPARRGRGWLWLMIVLVLAAALAAAGWKLYPWWQAHSQPVLAAVAVAPGDSSIGDPNAAIAALRREQHDLAQRMSDTTSGQQVLRDEVLGVGERAALLEQSVARIASPHAQGEQALHLDEAELLLTIGEQQVELSADVGSALHAYALADGTLADSTDPSALNLRQSLAQEIAALRALPPDPRASVAGQLDTLESTLDAPAFAASAPPSQPKATVLDRVVSSMVQVHRNQAQDLLDPVSRDAGLTAARLEITLARLALERRDANAFHAALARLDRWLPRLYAPETVARQRKLLDAMAHVPLQIELPALGGTLAELRRLREQQPELAAPATSNPAPASRGADPMPVSNTKSSR